MMKRFGGNPPKIKRMENSENIAIINQLKQKNEQCNEQISSLRKQLEDAIAFCKENDELKRKNKELATKIRESEAARDDVQRRIEILLKSNEELKTENSNLKEIIKNNEQKDNENEEKRIKSLSDQINKLSQQINENKEKISKDKITIDRLSSENTSILHEASAAFQQKMSSTKELIEFLNNYSTFSTESTLKIAEQNQEQNNEIIEKLTSCLEKTQKRLKEEKSQKKYFEQQNKEILQKYESLKGASDKQMDILEEQIKDLKEEISKMQKESAKKEKESQEIIDNLTMKLSKSKAKEMTKDEKEKIEKMSGKITILSHENEDLKEQIRILNEKLGDNENTSTAIQKQATSLTSQLQTIEMTHDTLKRKYQATLNELQEKTKELDKVKVQKSSVELDKSAMEEQVKTLNAKLKNAKISADKMESTIKENQAKTEKIVAGTAALESMCESQKKEIKDLVSMRDKFIILSKKQNNLLQSAEKELAQSNSQCKALKKALEQTEEKLNDEIRNPNKGEKIPVSSWFVSDFPRELCALITDFAKNDGLDDCAKLRNVLGTIQKFYARELEKGKKANEEKEKESNKKFETVDLFVSKVGALFDQRGLSCEEIVNNPIASHDVLSRINNVLSENANLSSEKAKANDNLVEIYDTLEVNSFVEAVTMIKNLFEKIHSLNEQVADEKAKFKVLKKQKKISEKTFNEKIAALNRSLELQEKDVNNMNSTIQKLEEELMQKTKEINQLKTENEELKIKNESLQKEIEQEKLDGARKIDEKIAFERETQRNEMEKKRCEIEEYKRKILDLEKEISQFRRSAVMIRSVRKEKDQQAQVLIEQFEEQSKEARAQFEREKQALKEQYDKYLSEVKTKNTELVNAHQEATDALREFEEKSAQVQIRMNELEHENDELRVKLEIANEEWERERRLFEMRQRSIVLTTEMKFQTMLEDQRSTFFAEKRKIIGFVVQQFRQYFDAHRELDDDCLRDVVTKAKSELDLLSSQKDTMRKLIGINKNQSEL